VILAEANHVWIHLRIQVYKSIGDYNLDVHKICAKLRFCEKKPCDEDKIEKTLTTMLPLDRILKHQYCARNYQHYSNLVQDHLQAEKNYELTMINHHQRLVGTTSLCQRSITVQRVKKRWMVKTIIQIILVNPRKEKISKHKKNKYKNQSSGKGKKHFKCHHCGGPNHIVKKCNIPQHLVDLYQKSLNEARKVKGSFEAHFNAASDEATTSDKIPDEAAKPSLMIKDYIDKDNMIIEYNPNDVFGDQD
jgi:hypothetical protein